MKSTFSEEMKNKSFWDLQKIVENSVEHTIEEVQAARLELEDRGHFEAAALNNKTIKVNESKGEIGNVTEKIEDIPTEFPAKPIKADDKSSLQKSIISMVVFIAAFYLIFKWDISYILILAGVILIHELGHYVAMRMFDYKDLSIFFIPFIGAYASGSKDTVSQKQQVIILLAGPIPGIIIGLFLYYYGLYYIDNQFIRASYIFILINLFNLLPIIPLDGGRVMKSIFFEKNEIINNIFIIISILMLTYISIKSKSYALLLIPYFLIMQLIGQKNIKKVKEGITNKGIDLEQSFEDLSNRDYWLIRDEIVTHIKIFSRYITPKRYIISSKESQLIDQIKSIIQKKPIMDISLMGKVLITLIWILTFIIPVVIIIFLHYKFGINK